MSAGTTLVEELERAARSCESFGTYYATSSAVRVDFMARAARLRQRAAWVRDLESNTAIPAAELAAALGIPYGTGKHHQIIGFTNELVARLTGPDIPAETAPNERNET